ncbi:hypothetical protein A2960_06320 [Candidatus Gottesmanbacteria bacterium RIFCSPLOWO2_01_FULL_39_12b]|uniref:Uncharacterized protein n=1 Tax=Candidatus Gottesmanbacteria bacterium RIFCSPLOWO2_01_FULL_39_12b TaxID=1798388 RepID=A0A1F6AP51_9BACT|nr:MAG: hypothetical protein A2960_06320 [Candidatus Gottesmanbacteria bacterium RIFCSPLOWO2_01_FULL_39_12b]
MKLFPPVYALDIADVWSPAQNTNFSSLGGLISFFLPKILLLGAIIFFILIIIAGFGVVINAGNDDAAAKEKARSFLTYAVVGLIIMFGAFWILQIINFLTNGTLGGIL